MGYMPTIPILRVGDDPEKANKDFRDAVRSFRDKVDLVPFLDGVHVQDVALANGSNVISHKLGRTPQGWIVTRARSAAPQLYETARDDKTITLNSTGTPTVNIWFF